MLGGSNDNRPEPERLSPQTLDTPHGVTNERREAEGGDHDIGLNHPANYAVLRNGNAGLHLGLADDMENPAGQGGCNFVTRDFDAAHQSVRDAGATFYIELSQIPTGARTFGIKDPDGNLITFVEAS